MTYLRLGRTALAAATLLLTLFSVSSQAALYAVDLDGNTEHDAVYDSVLDITWLADANPAGTALPWLEAEAFIDTMNLTAHLGVTNWRQTTNSGCVGYGCGRPANSADNDPTNDTDPSTDTNALHDTDDELGYHYYRNFESPERDGFVYGSNTTNIALFSNIQTTAYWTETEVNATTAYRFNNTGEEVLQEGNAGSYGTNIKTLPWSFYVWPVADGNVGGASVVPVPAAAWLFGSALAGLGLLRRSSENTHSVSGQRPKPARTKCPAESFAQTNQQQSIHQLCGSKL